MTHDRLPPTFVCYFKDTLVLLTLTLVLEPEAAGTCVGWWPFTPLCCPRGCTFTGSWRRIPSVRLRRSGPWGSSWSDRVCPKLTALVLSFTGAAWSNKPHHTAGRTGQSMVGKAESQEAKPKTWIWERLQGALLWIHEAAPDGGELFLP